MEHLEFQQYSATGITALTHMLLVVKLAKTKRMRKTFKKMTETLAHGYSLESTQQELINEYQHDRF